MSLVTHSLAEVVDMFGGGKGRWLMDGCRAGKYPHLRVGRSIRFTEKHLDALTELLEQKAQPRPTRSADLSVLGASQRSASRHRKSA